MNRTRKRQAIAFEAKNLPTGDACRILRAYETPTPDPGADIATKIKTITANALAMAEGSAIARALGPLPYSLAFISDNYIDITGKPITEPDPYDALTLIAVDGLHVLGVGVLTPGKARKLDARHLAREIVKRVRIWEIDQNKEPRDVFRHVSDWVDEIEDNPEHAEHAKALAPYLDEFRGVYNPMTLREFLGMAYSYKKHEEERAESMEYGEE